MSRLVCLKTRERWLPVLLILLLLLLASSGRLHAQQPEREWVLDSTLQLLLSLRDEAALPPRLQSIVRSEKAAVAILFAQASALGDERLLRMEQELGIEFDRQDGRLIEQGRVRGAWAPWSSLADLARWPGVERVDSLWKPAVAPCLDLSVHETGAWDLWTLTDQGGWPVTGRGVTIAVFDYGVDVFHPDFWRVDGGSYPWLDVNGNSAFDAGVDAVDLDRDGWTAPGELLNLLDSTSDSADPVTATGDGRFHPAWDWLYNDANRNGQRDYGSGAGYGELNPTYGERLFHLDDTNHNAVVDVGESLLALGTNKVVKFVDGSGREYVRGTDLIDTPGDVAEGGHGTHVCSITSGGAAEGRRFAGMAPDSSLLVHEWLTTQGDNAFTQYTAWAAQNGADVMLYEYGSWVQEFLDGSSALEQTLNTYANQGIVQVAPAGNLGRSQKHAHLLLSRTRPEDVRLLVPMAYGIREAYLTLLWQGAVDALNLRLTTPNGESAVLPPAPADITLAGHTIRIRRDHSVRNTSRLDLTVLRQGLPIGDGVWTFRLQTDQLQIINVNAYTSDEFVQWEGGIAFLDRVDSMYTVTSPGTADSAITVASYASRSTGGDTAGSLSPFSGQGPRIDGEPVVDLAAPGHYDNVACASSKDLPGALLGQYNWFGGTSASAPHAAGAVALMLQYTPELSPAQVKSRLQATARKDSFTGSVYSQAWGHGKLDVAVALGAPERPTPTPRARALIPVIVR